jgi:thiamine transporter ThiT
VSGVPFAFVGETPRERRLLWLLDVVAWVLVLVCGIRVATGGSPTIQYVLTGAPALVIAFAAFWVVGGVAGLITRLLRLGIAEVPAITATLTALVIYEVAAAFAAAHGFAVGLLPTVSAVVIVVLISRWVVLHGLGRKRPATHPRDRTD